MVKAMLDTQAGTDAPRIRVIAHLFRGNFGIQLTP
jgi:hypothetical protein